LAGIQAFAQQVHAVAEQQAAQRVQAGDAAVAQAAQFAAWNANLATQAILADIPELHGVDPDQIGTAIQTLARVQPQRAQQIANKIQGLQHLALQAAQAEAAQTQNQQRQFHSWATEQDNVFDAAFPRLLPGVDSAKVRAQAMQTLRDAGIDDATARRLYNESDIFRSSSAQILLAKASAWDAYRKEISAAKATLNHQRKNPVPNVIKPGVVDSFTRGYEEATRLPSQFNSAKDAADWLISARRGGRR
jgi:hypothetical protein